jgi:hypothetical protein
MRKHYQEVKDYILANLDSKGQFKQTYSQMDEALNINQATIRLIVLQIIKEGFLEVIHAPKKGATSSPLYRIKSTKLIQQPKRFTVQDETNEVNTSNVDVLNEMVVEFDGVDLILIEELRYGTLLSIEDFSVATLIDKTLTAKIIKANENLFIDEVVEIDGRSYITQKGIMTILMKVNLDRVIETKRLILQRFQEQILRMMSAGRLSAKVKLLENNRLEIVSNVSKLIEVNVEDVHDMIQEIEEQVNEYFGQCIIDTAICQETSRKLIDDNHLLENRLASIEKSKDGLLLENRSLRTKLLER